MVQIKLNFIRERRRGSLVRLKQPVSTEKLVRSSEKFYFSVGQSWNMKTPPLAHCWVLGLFLFTNWNEVLYQITYCIYSTQHTNRYSRCPFLDSNCPSQDTWKSGPKLQQAYSSHRNTWWAKVRIYESSNFPSISLKFVIVYDREHTPVKLNKRSRKKINKAHLLARE